MKRGRIRPFAAGFLTTVLAIVLASTAFAAVGDIAGDYYSTDIVTSVNGSPIESINAGGRTLISAEDLAYHGFNVAWDGSARTLKITKSATNTMSGQQVSKSTRPVGTRLGSIYYTDIVTYLDGKKIDSYNTGGRTYICAEDMTSYGYDVIWNAKARTLTINMDKTSISQTTDKKTHIAHLLASTGWDLSMQTDYYYFLNANGSGIELQGVPLPELSSVTYTISDNKVIIKKGSTLAEVLYFDAKNDWFSIEVTEGPYTDLFPVKTTTAHEVFSYLRDSLALQLNSDNPNDFNICFDLHDLILEFMKMTMPQNEYAKIEQEETAWDQWCSQQISSQGIDTTTGDGRYIVRTLNRNYTRDRIDVLIKQL